MGDRAHKNALFDGLGQVAKALGNGRRAEIIDVLAQGERSVDDLARQVDQTVANTSHHLQVLLRAGLVTTRRAGTRVFYALASDQVAQLWGRLRDVSATHVAELDMLAAAYLGDRTDLDTITREQLLDRLQAGDVVVLDVRPSAEYQAGHIPGAISLPIEDVASRLDEIPAHQQIVAYCRGSYCVYADNAVRLLRDHGQPAARLEDGFPEWSAANLPVTTARPESPADPHLAGRGRRTP